MGTSYSMSSPYIIQLQYYGSLVHPLWLPTPMVYAMLLGSHGVPVGDTIPGLHTMLRVSSMLGTSKYLGFMSTNP